jgi:hypothetical protein
MGVKPFSIIIDNVQYTEPQIKAFPPHQMRAFADLLRAKHREIEHQGVVHDDPERARKRASIIAIFKSAESQVRYWMAELGLSDDDFFKAFHGVAVDELDPQDYQEMAATARAHMGGYR